MHDLENEPAVVVRPQPEKSFPWGCLLGGCLGALLLMVGGVLALGLGSYWIYKKQVAQYTSTEARELPVVEVSKQELQEIESKVEDFQEQVDKGESPPQLILTAEEINALISQQENLRGRVFVTIENSELHADVSIPTDALPGAKGRFFNGAVSLEASLENGVVIVTLQNAEVNGQAVPESIMADIRKQNLAKDLHKDPEVAKKLRQFESLRIEGDKIILTPKEVSELDAEQTGETQQSTSDTAATEPASAASAAGSQP